MVRLCWGGPPLGLGGSALPAQPASAGRSMSSLRGLARLRIVHCVVTADVALRRVLQRSEDDPLRSVHADPRSDRDLADFARQRDAFDRVSVEAPWMEVDTTDGYQPGLEEIVRFVNSQG